MNWIPFTKANYTLHEENILLAALRSGRLEGDGPYTKKVHQYFHDKYACKNALMTTSGTDALELAALLLDLKPDDEVIVPSYTFVSSAHAFALRGVKVIFADSQENHPNLCLKSIQSLISKKTKAIVPVHYAGFACQMDELIKIAESQNVTLVADAAQAIDSKYKGQHIGKIGHLVTYSFHQTKNISCGEGGMLIINDERFSKRAEILREKGTNRAAFFRGEIDKYTCVDIGSSYLASDLNASLLSAQLDRLEEIQFLRMKIWDQYHRSFSSIANRVQLPQKPEYTSHNAHCYYLVCDSLEERTKFISYMKSKNIAASFHYNSLHQSPFYRQKYSEWGIHTPKLPYADRYTDCLVRIPLYPTMTEQEVTRVVTSVLEYFKA